MSADQFLTLDGRPTVRVERQYPHPIEKVWRAVTTPEHLEQWFPSPVEVDLHRVLAFDVGPTGGPGKHLRVEFAEGTGHGVRLTLTVTGADNTERDEAIGIWGTDAVGHLAASAAEWALAQPAKV